MVDRMPTRKYAYFRDDQIMVLATHDSEQLNAIDLEEFHTALSQQMGSLIITEPPQPFSFPAVTVDDLDKRLEELKHLEILMKTEEKQRRLEELQRLERLLDDEAQENEPDDVKKLKKLLKRADKQKLLGQAKKRENTLFESNVSPGVEDRKSVV